MDNYRIAIESHLLPAFQDQEVAAISAADVVQWEKRERALGYAAASIRLWRTTLASDSRRRGGRGVTRVESSLYRSEMRFGLRCLRVFVDHPVEDHPTADPRSIEVDNSWPGVRGVGWALVAALVRSVLVVVPNEFT